MEPESSLQYSQEPTIVPYPEPKRCSSYLHNLIYNIHLNIILQSVPSFSQEVSSLSYIVP